MAMLKRIFLFGLVNLLVIITISTLLRILGIEPYIGRSGFNMGQLMGFCLIWGMGGAFISLLLSRVMAKWMMGVEVIDPQNVRDPELQWLVNTVHSLAQRANLPKMPEVGVYNSPDLNAFATGPTKSRSLVAVSTGLLNSMDREGIEGVLGHEIAHISNGDMVTMTLIQGVINAFVMFIARIVAFAISQAVNERARPWVEWMIIMALEIALSLLGFLVVAAFSRWREFRADFGGAQLAGRNKMIVALQQLARNYQIPVEKHESIAALQISGKEKSGLAALMSTHPPLELRIQKLREYQMV